MCTFSSLFLLYPINCTLFSYSFLATVLKEEHSERTYLALESSTLTMKTSLHGILSLSKAVVTATRKQTTTASSHGHQTFLEQVFSGIKRRADHSGCSNIHCFLVAATHFPHNNLTPGPQYPLTAIVILAVGCWYDCFKRT